jgi:lysozyme
VTCVNKSVKAAIDQSQFDAMVDFVFNLGCAAFGQSTLLRMVNAGDFAGAAGQFLRWNKAGGKVLAGLTKRRQGEMALFQRAVGGGPAGVPAVSAAATNLSSMKTAVKSVANAVDRKVLAKKKAAKQAAAKQ